MEKITWNWWINIYGGLGSLKGFNFLGKLGFYKYIHIWFDSRCKGYVRGSEGAFIATFEGLCVL